MNVKTQTIAGIFQGWLKRYSPPNVMKNDADVMKAERDSLLRVLLKFSPDTDYDGWVNRVLDQLEYQMKTRAWPTKGELGAVCSNLRKMGHGDKPMDIEPRDPDEVNAERINNNQAVGDEWIYGANAVRLSRTGLVSEAQFRRYRSALYFAAKDAVGEERAKRQEASWIKRHEAAERVFAGGAKFHAPTYEPKRFGGAA